MENLQPGQMLGPYRIINQIGQGGMAAVYKAYQPSMDRNVAIKVLPSQLADSKEFVARFQREARTIARLEHPHILPVFDFGEDHGVTYFVMRYLEAGTLKDRMVAGRPLPLDEIDRIFTQLCDALGYAHSQGVVHRDLKPANALVDSAGNLFLTDFGIAKLLESASPRLTQTDAIMGTPAYISPEQAQAQPVDQRSDIYSLGIILYEMVTGRVPYVADTPLAVILKHLSDPLPLPSILKSDVPNVIEQVILKALAKNPDDRFATTGEFVSAWKRALREMDTIHSQPEKVPTPVVARPTVTPVQPPVRTPIQPVYTTQTGSKARKPLTGMAIGCVALACLAIAGSGLFLFASGWLNRAAPAATDPPQVATNTLIPPTVAPTSTEVPVPTSSSLLSDDFSDSNVWGTGTDADSAVEYVDHALNFDVFKKNYFVWSTPNGEVYQNIHMEVTVRSNNTDPTTAFGLMCDQQTETSSFYYFAITPAGQYAIAKAVTGETDLFLTNNDKWEYSDAITAKAASYRVGVDCGSNGKLTLYVDGKQVDSVTDTTYTSGGVGVITWSGEEATNTNVSFDDFIMTSLP